MRICDRCGESVPGDARICPECGAPFVPGAIADIPEDVHRELARANLLRVRGEFDSAESICLAVLRRFPNSAPAHTMLGDIADDRDRLEDAERWYDLALDLDPESASDRRKVEDVRARKRALESQSTVEQIGLPTREPLPRWAAGTMAILAVGLCVAIALSVNRGGAKPAVPAVITAPVTASPESVVAVKPEPEATPKVTEPVVTEPAPVTPFPAPAANSGAQEDEATLRNLTQRSPYGSNLLSAIHDPRQKILTLTYAVRGTEDPRRIGSELARTALENELEVLTVAVRAVREGHLSFLADVPRTRYADTLATAWQEENAADPDAFMRYVLTNEWTPPVTPASETAGGP